MDHKLDKDYLDQLIIEKKQPGLNEENFSNWRNRFYWILLFKQAKKKGFNVYSISLNKPKAYRYPKRVIKYIKVDFSNFENLKEKLTNNTFDYVINAGGYGEHLILAAKEII